MGSACVAVIDAHNAVAGALVAERVLDLRNAAVLRVGKEVLAHGLGGRAVENDLVVFEGDRRPAIAVRSEGEALILGVAALGNLVVGEWWWWVSGGGG